MIDALTVFALIGGLWAADRGVWSAWPLIASAALSSALILARVPFDIGLWVLIDAAAIVAIEAGPVRTQERIVIASFVPVFVLYQTQPEWWPQAVCLIVALQFLVITPWDRLGELRTWTEKAA